MILPRPFPAIMDSVGPRDAIDLMAWPCFSLAKRPRHTPMVHEYRGEFFRVSPSRERWVKPYQGPSEGALFSGA